MPFIKKIDAFSLVGTRLRPIKPSVSGLRNWYFIMSIFDLDLGGIGKCSVTTCQVMGWGRNPNVATGDCLISRLYAGRDRA